MSVLAAIHGLDDDFEVGKLTEADYREMRLALRAEAVELLRVERAALAEAAGAERAAHAKAAGVNGTPKSCPRCEATTGANARFCSQCGAPLDPGGATDGVSPV